MPNAVRPAQRRQLTVLFCDLVGSTPLSAELDPEDMQEVVHAFFACCRECIEAAGGFVAKYMGDGLLAYFGFPEAHEDDVPRAIQAGLTIAASVAGLPTPHGRALAVRTGIATGLAVVGEALGAGAAAELGVVGDTPNLAARLQQSAAPDTVVVSGATRELALGLFDFVAQPAPLKDFAGELTWRVTGVRVAPSRFEPRRDRGLSRFVGREAELEQVLAAWREAVGGSGGVIGIYGPAGIEKSRLVHEAQRRIAREPHVVLAGAGVPVLGNSPFQAIVQMLRRRLRRIGGDPLAALKMVLNRATIPLDPALPLVADLLGLAIPIEMAAPVSRADARRRALIEVLTTLLDRTAQRWPTLMLVEDLHWVDPSSIELLERIAAIAGQRHLLIVFTARDEPPVPTLGTVRHIAIGGLRKADMRDLLGAVASLPQEAVEGVIERSGGVPLFAEELAALVDTHEAGGASIPATLSDLLMARLGTLGTALPLAQAIAVLGSRCGNDLLARVVDRHADETAGEVATMVASGLIEQRRSGIVFRHALIRDAAYAALLRRDCRRLHARAATVIASEFPALLDAQPEVVAHHLTEAGSPEAIAAWLRAGRALAARSAYVEAERAFRRGLGLLAGEQESDGRDARELQLQSAMAGVAQIVHGYSAPVTLASIARARILAERGGDLGRQFDHSAGQWSAASSAGDYASAGRLASQTLRLARACARPNALAVAHMIALTTRYRVGDVLGAEEAFERGRDHFASAAFTGRTGAIEQTFGNAAIVAWLMGEDGEARQRLQPVLERAATAERPYVRAMAAFMAALALGVGGAFTEAYQWAGVAAKVSDDHGFPQYTSGARIILGRATAECGAADAGVRLLREGVTAIAATPLRAAMTLYLTWLAEVELRTGDIAAARASVERALGANPLERFWRAESLRVRAEVALAEGDVAAAAADAAAAIATAREIGARGLYLRARASPAAAMAMDGLIRRAS